MYAATVAVVALLSRNEQFLVRYHDTHEHQSEDEEEDTVAAMHRVQSAEPSSAAVPVVTSTTPTRTLGGGPSLRSPLGFLGGSSTPTSLLRPHTALPVLNNSVGAASPRKELGPSTRTPLQPREPYGGAGGGGLVHSRSGVALQRGSYDGKIAGLYDLEETLGRGHFAVVKLARHVFTGEKVAVKVIDKTKLDEVSRAHLFQEVRCMKLVQHPNVVRLYEVIDTQTKLYLILELADGGDLYDYIMRHEEGLAEDQARTYFRQIVHAISYCHKLHVVHRDLKPENVVFFERLGVVKLTDFGFSNRFDPGQKLETSCGSLAYSAPEILLGDSYDAPAVDVWSLGVILYMLVCGHAPFQEANDSETLTMIMDCKYSIPSYVSADCAKLIGRMLVRAPERRATLEQLAADPWLSSGPSVSPGELLEAPLVSRESLSEEDHTHIVHKMVAGKIATKEEILEALDKNEYNHITATYFLLAERKLRAQRQEQALRGSTGSLTGSQVLSQSRPPASGLSAASPSPLLLSPGSPGDLVLGKVMPSRPLLAPSPALLSVPSEQQAAARGRKCSIVTEEDDDECDSESGRDSGPLGGTAARCMLSRRGSRSEGKLSLALQQRLAEARSSHAAPPPSKPPAPQPPRTTTTTTILSSATVCIPPGHIQQPAPPPSPSKFKTMPGAARPLHSVCSSPQLTLNEIFEEGASDVGKKTVPPPPPITTAAAVVPRVVVTRQKFHKNRTASCSSSDASDEDSESRKKRVHKLKTLPSNSRRRDSHDDSSDSQGGQGGGGGVGGGDSTNPESRSGPAVSESGGEKQQSSGSSSSNGRRHTGFRRRCGTAGETRLRESQSLNRITEVQESSESLTQTLNHQQIQSAAATSPRSRRSFGARFLLLVGKKPTETKEEKENCSKTKITRYFHLHRKLCLPMFKANNNHNNSHHPGSGGDGNGVVWTSNNKPA